MSLTVNALQEDGRMVIVLEGRLDGMTMEGFIADVRRIVSESTGTYVVDFAAVPYVSSAGLRGILILAKEAMQRGAKLVLCSPDQMVREVFQLARLSHVVPVFDTRVQALEQSAKQA